MILILNAATNYYFKISDRSLKANSYILVPFKGEHMERHSCLM